MDRCYATGTMNRCYVVLSAVDRCYATGAMAMSYYRCYGYVYATGAMAMY